MDVHVSVELPTLNNYKYTTIVPLHIVIITSSNQFGAKRNGCSWWEFDWRRWERTPFEFSEQCLSKILALVLHDMSCRMPKDCWGNRFLEEDGNCEIFFCHQSNRPLVWGTWQTRLNFSRMSCLFLTVLGWTWSRKGLNMVAELDCPKRSVVTVRPGRD